MARARVVWRHSLGVNRTGFGRNGGSADGGGGGEGAGAGASESENEGEGEDGGNV